MLSMDGWRRNMASNVEIPVETMTGIVGKEVSRKAFVRAGALIVGLSLTTGSRTRYCGSRITRQ